MFTCIYLATVWQYIKKKLYNHILSRVNSKGVLQKRTNQLHVVMKNLH